MIQAAAALRARYMQHKRAWILAYGVVPFLVGFWVIASVFNRDGVFPLDTGDEPAETFIQVPMALSQLAQGHILKINLFNNFGTPILGEPVVYPWALHAWTYALFRPMVAMLVNKFLLAALTMAVLTLFFRRYFSLLISSLCAFLAFSGPQFFYFFQNHPHQGALFYYGCVLIAVRRFLDCPGRARAFWVYATSLVALLSVGINGSLLGTGFLFAYAALMAGRRWRLAGLAAALWGAAFICVSPHYREFFRLAAESARKDLNYQELAFTPGLVLLKQLLLADRQSSAVAIFYSWPVLVLILAGLAFAGLTVRRAAASARAGHAQTPGPATAASVPRFPELCRLGVLLGLLPCLAILLLRLFPGVAQSLPLVRATNITRVLWFSDLFLMLSAGLAVHCLGQILPGSGRGWRAAWLALLALALVPRFLVFDRQTRCYYMNEEVAKFQPQEFVPRMKPFTRLAALTDPVPYSADTKANAHQLLGSAGRSIILNKAFRDYLERAGLIARGYYGMTYFFKPAAPEVLAPFGIRYVLRYCDRTDDTLNEQFLKSGWRNMGSHEFEAGAKRFHIVLFGSPYDVTPFYLMCGSDPAFLQDYRIEGNEIRVELPAGSSPCVAVATFLALPGWKAFINDAPATIERGEDQFIRVAVPPLAAQAPPTGAANRGRTLLLRYEPYSDAFLAGLFVLSLLAAGGLSWLAGRHPKTGI
ncbi:MAG: hypothetical protein WCL11_08230 [Verrucomicrobiota bacterium]